ncbi:MAG TPA: glycoside hydrolase family 28 protein [Lacunisphaera sp.]|nr:glycoside hydrolase family 28 protein [Lacunisphaera sp.]
MRTRFRLLSLLLTTAGWGGVLCAASPDFNVADYGAVGDGRTPATAAIQRAIDACAAAGGGRVVLPAGTFRSGPVFLRSNVDFHLSPGAVLAGSENFADYPAIDGRWEGIERKIHASLLTALNATNVAITGEGTLDCHGAPWWAAALEVKRLRQEQGIKEREPDNPPGAPLAYPRPRAIYLQDCRKVRLSGITILNSPSWNIHPVYCDDVVIDGVTITAPAKSPNTDGIDPDSCRNVRIANCRIGCGDDGIIIKSGYNADGRRVGRVCEDIVITNCVIGPAIAAVGIGSETSGGVRNVTVSNCVFDGAYNGLRVKSGRGRGAFVEDFRADNIVMRNLGGEALSITTYYDSKDRTPHPVDEGTPVFRHLAWSNLTIDGARDAGVIEGLPERYLEDVRLDHVVVRHVRRGLSAVFVDGLHLSDWDLDGPEKSAVTVEQSRNVRFSSVNPMQPPAGAPFARFVDVDGAVVRHCTPPAGTAVFLQLAGSGTKGVVLQANWLAGAARPTELTDGAAPGELTVVP